MKIEQIIVEYLYQNKEVSLQGIGSFSLQGNFALPDENSKDLTIPEDAIAFNYNLRAQEDEGLIDFIVKKTGKIKPLASADLDSFIILTKQFLNIGKPFIIEGLGTIQKNQEGIYVYYPGNFMVGKEEIAVKQIKEKQPESVSFENKAEKNNSKVGAKIFFFILFLATAGAATYYYFFINQDSQSSQTEVVIADSTANTPDTTANNIDSVANHKPDTTIVISDTIGFKIAVKKYNTKDLAEKGLQKLTAYGHKLSMLSIDSTTYYLIMDFTSPKSDTTRAKDSLRKFFGSMPIVLP